MKYINKLVPTELAYIAGAFDGEGTLALNRVYPNHRLYYNAQVKVYNTNLDFVRWLQNRTRIGKIVSMENVDDTWKTEYAWYLENKDAAYLLPKILPYLVIKTEQAKSILEFLSLPKPSQRTLEESNKADYLYTYCKVLNKKGAEEQEEKQFFGTRWSKDILTLKDTELSYIAAILDGEGYIGITRAIGTKRILYYPNMKVNNNNTELLLWLRDTTQLGKIQDIQQSNKKWKTTYVWTLSKLEIALFLPKVLPYLIIKEHQAQAVLNLLVLPKSSQKAEEMYYVCKTFNETGQREL